jgi:hypothetical protein
MRQIAYFSTAAEPQSTERLNDILITARTNNRRDSITGLLVAGGNRYMQVFEGPADAVKRLYTAIRRDPRHLCVTTLINRPVAERTFPRWSMASHREPALGQFDTFPQTLRYLTQQVEDKALRRQIELFARGLIAVPDEARTPWDLSAA